MICARSAAALLALLLITGPVASSGDAYSERGAIFQDPEFNFQFIRTIGYSASGGADINECLGTAGRIKDGEAESWYQEWQTTASRLEAIADSFLSQGHRLGAREAYLRASNYYRNAGFYLDMDREETEGMRIVADVLAEISDDGSSIKIQIKLKIPWPCLNPTVRADLTRMPSGSLV